MSPGKISFGALMVVMFVSAVSAEHEPVTTQVVVSGLEVPIEFVQHPTDPSVQFVNERVGRIKRIIDGVLSPTDFLDFRERVNGTSEQGMLGLAFPADYPSDPHFYIHYSSRAVGFTTVSRLTHIPNAPLVADPDSEEIILTVVQRTSSHNGD